MAQTIKFGVPYRIVMTDGTVIWLGTQMVSVEYLVQNAEASSNILPSEAVKIDTTAASLQQIPRVGPSVWNPNSSATWPPSNITVGGYPATVTTASTDTPTEGILFGLRIAGTTDIGFIGVAMEAIAPGKVGRVCGAGSITCVRTTTAPITQGNRLGGSVVAGAAALVTLPGSYASATSLVPSSSVGTCLVPNLTSAIGFGGFTGSTSQAGVLVNPGF